MKPETWGPALWKSIHLIALGYPNSPSQMDKMNYKMFFVSLGNVLPCRNCVKNYLKHFAELPVDRYLGNKDELFEWTVKLHNIVNRDIGKGMMSLYDAKNLYKAILKEKPACWAKGTKSNVSLMVFVISLIYILILYFLLLS